MAGLSISFPFAAHCVLLFQFGMVQTTNMIVEHNKTIQLSIEYTETHFSNKIVANLSNMLENTGVPMWSGESGVTHSPLFELLDVSANILTYFRSHRSSIAQMHQIVKLEPRTGLVQFQVPIDRERICPDVSGTNHICTINLLILAHKRTKNDEIQHDLDQQMIYIDLSIIILDLNDNAPYFSDTSSAYHTGQTIWIEEELTIGSLISLPEAKDADSLANGIRQYQFHPTATSFEIRQHFQIIHLSDNQLNCEQTQIPILQYNNHSPPPPLTNTTIVKPCLQVIHRIDREKIEHFTFRLVALDSEQRRCETNVRLLIKDINDHRPEWAHMLTYFDAYGQPKLTKTNVVRSEKIQNQTESWNEYTLPVRECMKQRKLLQLQVNDKDDPETLNGRFTIELSKKTPNMNEVLQRFSISHDHYLCLTDLGLRDLGYSNLSLALVAKDGGGAEGLAWVHLKIEDCNNYRPMIIMKKSQFTIPENSSTNPILIGLITVRDLDLVESPNSKFQCYLNDTTFFNLVKVIDRPSDQMTDPSITDHSVLHEYPTSFHRHGRWSVYRLETRTGVVFDREVISICRIELQCKDAGSPVLISDKVITIGIEDVNDNAPRFVSTKSPGQRQISHDSSNWLTKSETRVFNMNSHIRDQSIFEYNILENMERGSMIAQMQAVDADIGENARLDFQLIVNNETGEAEMIEKTFSVSSNGQFYLIGELDREKIDHFQFSIRVADHGTPHRLSSSATILINIDDVNDCHPVFHAEYTFKVVESYGSSTIHQILGTLEATDADAGRNGTISYRLATDQDDVWSDLNVPGSLSVNFQNRYTSQVVKVTHDGQVAVYGVVDREKTPVLLFDVIAEDDGVPKRLSTVTTVTIHVLDLNDNKPRFRSEGHFTTTHEFNMTRFPSETMRTLNISLDTGVGTVLTKFEAIDPDDGPNGTVFYTLVHALKSSNSTQVDDTPAFTLQPDGQLILSNHLETEKLYSPSFHNISTTSRYRRPDRLLIKASDSGLVRQHSVLSLHIHYFDPMRNTAASLVAAKKFNQTDTGDQTKRNIEGSNNNHPFAATGLVQGSSIHNREAHSRQYTHGVSILYLLALAICFALILIITSLLYLYLRMRRPLRIMDRTKHSGEINPKCHARTDRSQSREYNFGDLRLTSNFDARSLQYKPHQSKESEPTLHCSVNESNPGSDNIDDSKSYRTLSPAVIYVNGEGFLHPAYKAGNQNTSLFTTPVYTDLTPTTIDPIRQSVYIKDDGINLFETLQTSVIPPCVTSTKKLITDQEPAQKAYLCSQNFSYSGSNQCSESWDITKSMKGVERANLNQIQYNNHIKDETKTLPGYMKNSCDFKQTHTTGSFV